VYPDATPGGWQLLGTTDLKMWDLARDPPALLQPGMRVRFVDETTKSIADGAYPTRASGQKPKSTSGATPPDDGRPALIVQASGLQTLVQDAGRPGLAAQGVSAAGALDAGAMRRANRLVGNASNQPVLEALAGGLQLTSQGDTVLAVTGATGALMLSRADGRTWPVERNQALALAAGDTLMLGQPATGLRSYVAVRGGFVIAPVLGSASRDTLAKIGPPALTAGQHLPWATARLQRRGHARPGAATLPKAGDTVTLDVTSARAPTGSRPKP
jgi:allophanate hydrolase subunit 2